MTDEKIYEGADLLTPEQKKVLEDLVDNEPTLDEIEKLDDVEEIGDIPEWEKGFKEESFAVPDFPITLKPWLNKVYDLIIKSFPSKPVKTSIGDSFVMEVYNNKMVNSIFINRSLAFSLAKIRRNNNWVLKDMIGKRILLQKTEGLKDGKSTHYLTAKLYSPFKI